MNICTIIETVVTSTVYNRGHIEASLNVGCLKCKRLYSSRRIKKWIKELDQNDTGVCSICSNQMLIPDVLVPTLDQALVENMANVWYQSH
uniref:DNA-directed RNA polymerase subunit RPC12/RpoP n=1 Tax=Clandestinovirus TaxID=2831644 RepID=A0A8F8KSI7_9VIRU|nr:DNA-directed RNA polymerase subunit RPC12/RpoP [Clandestinovirus]